MPKYKITAKAPKTMIHTGIAIAQYLEIKGNYYI
jgi:hypothetical protein